jgi:hypothetical protein
MNQKARLAFAKEAANSMKTETDLSDFSRMLNKVTVEAALGAELDDHLGYDKHQPSKGSNSRNGHSSKTRYTDDGVWIWTCLVTEIAHLSRSWLNNNRLALRAWTTQSSFATPRA